MTSHEIVQVTGGPQGGGGRRPGGGGPAARRRAFTADYKRRILAEIEAATQSGATGAIPSAGRACTPPP